MTQGSLEQMAERVTPKVVLGVSLMLAGATLTLGSLGIGGVGYWLRLWPLALVAVGVARFLSPRPGSRLGDAAWIVSGGLLLALSLGLLSFAAVWPLFLIFAGGVVTYRGIVAWPVPVATLAETSSTLDMTAILGGGRRTISSADFRGGSLVAFLGGCEIDLRSSSIAGPEAVLDVTAVWGGVDLRVPEDWCVECRGVALLGGFADKTHGRADSPQRLVITGLALMGGVAISN